ncbi:MAG: LamG-like jellyroll fold domain-containing protein [Candidatus Paceibacterota bacterium]
MSRIIRKAFTLIELLVVIAIIGILSGLIVVTMNGVTAKANIAKSQVFSNSLRNALMLNLVSEWKLDGNGNDSWSGGNNGTWHGSGGGTNTSANYRPSSECIFGQCLSFDGTDDYLDFGAGTNLDIANEITVSVWVYPMYSGANEQLIYYKGGPGFTSSGGIRIGTKNGSFRVLFWDGANSRNIADISYVINNWYSLVFTGRKGDSMRAYLNGSLCPTTSSFTDGIGASGVNLSIGCSSGAYCFYGLIDDSRVFNAVLPVSKIEEQYYTGLNGLLISGGISKEEYLSRVGSDFAKN